MNLVNQITGNPAAAIPGPGHFDTPALNESADNLPPVASFFAPSNNDAIDGRSPAHPSHGTGYRRVHKRQEHGAPPDSTSTPSENCLIAMCRNRPESSAPNTASKPWIRTTSVCWHKLAQWIHHHSRQRQFATTSTSGRKGQRNFVTCPGLTLPVARKVVSVP